MSKFRSPQPELIVRTKNEIISTTSALGALVNFFYFCSSILGLKFTLPSRWCITPANRPLINSDINTTGTTCKGSYPMIKRTGVKVVPYPIPNVESMYSQKKASITILMINHIEKPNIISSSSFFDKKKRLKRSAKAKSF